MQVITDAKELEKHTYIKTRNPAVFPKKERLGLAQRMMNEASDLVADLMEANDLLLTDPEERELRYRAQRSALRNCRKLIHHIELAHEILSGFGDDAFAYWAKMAAGVKNQTAKWYKTDKERAAKLDAQKRHHADRQGREKSASQEHRQHEAQDPQVPRAGGLRQDDTRQRRAILRELDGPHLTRQHLPPAAEHGRLFLQLFPGAQTITERRQHSWPKN